MTVASEITVLYVARGDLHGLANAQAFADSCRQHPSGLMHEMIFIAKHWSIDDRVILGKIARSLDARVIDLPDDGYDWSAYVRACRLISTRWVCLLNSHSQPMTENWLAFMLNAAKAPGVGMAGASGSWESLIPNCDQACVFSRLRTIFHIALRFNLYRKFEQFPNPHLRSNALVIKRTLFLLFFSTASLPRTKIEAQILESGKSGLTSFLKGLGLSTVVACRDGAAYRYKEWPYIENYRAGKQRNLLVSDNRTRDYDQAPPNIKLQLQKLSWGGHLSRS